MKKVMTLFVGIVFTVGLLTVIYLVDQFIHAAWRVTEP